MSIGGSGRYKKQTNCKTYEYQKFLHGFPVSIFQNQTETVQAYTVNLIFQRISEIDSDLHSFIHNTWYDIYYKNQNPTGKQLFITSLRVLSLDTYLECEFGHDSFF
ncbi:hypothetical protein LEP1GSC073_3757 [Leptospira noguchii str. Cascata]|nr:hypothetical protein LEP1GSC072_0983 [Leptospira noguchii str. Bonito]EMS82681.1 hypothetical protein LEP1GSC073_3757 [Leptospira noguchii str. Cascata]